MRINKTIFSIIIVFILWYIVFSVKPFNFWLSMSFATLVLLLMVFIFDKSVFFNIKINFKTLFFSIVSSLFLYLIFFFGNIFLIFVNSKFHLLNNRIALLNNIYSNKTGVSPIIISLLIIFPIAFGEEIFWRGFIQKNIETKTNGYFSLLITTFFYSFVHISSFNPILILAALTCGIFWGFIYMKTKNITLVILSHIFWDILIFVLFPIL